LYWVWSRAWCSRHAAWPLYPRAVAAVLGRVKYTAR
jgi:hypothetical protein